MVDVTTQVDEAPNAEQQALARQQAAATGQVFNPITAKSKKDKENKGETLTPAKFSQMGPIGQFLVSMLLLLTQMVDPDNKSNNSLVNLISKAFGFDDEGKDPEHKQYRQLRNDINTKGRNYVRDTREHAVNPGTAREAIAAGASLISRNTPANPTERQNRVMAVIGDASRSAGVSSDLAVGMWGYESSFGKNLKSPTGCQGDFQFTRTTLAEVISKKGSLIASDLNEKAREFAASTNPAQRALAADLQKQAQMVENIQAQTQGMNGSQLESFASKNKTALDSLANTPEASTYAATHYMKMVADQMKLNPNNQRDFGLIYAGYNIGVGHALDIKNGKRAQGWEVDVNPVAKGGKEGYDRAIASRLTSAEGRNFSALARQDSRSGEGLRYAEAPAPTGKGLAGTPPISGPMQSAATGIPPQVAAVASREGVAPPKQQVVLSTPILSLSS